MKITVSKKEINDALKVVLKACPSKAAVPIITGILLDAIQGGLTLQATDYTISLTARINANIEEGGSVVVNGKQFTEICNKLSGDIVTLQTDENILKIESESAKFSVIAMNADDYPTLQVSDSGNYFALLESDFVHLIKKIAFAANDNDDRPLFTCVNFRFTKETETLAVAATNTHRLATKKMSFSTPQKFDDFDVNVPAKKLLDIVSVIPQVVGRDIHFGLNEKNFWVKFGKFLATIRLVDGKFPPYENVIPTESTTSAKIDVDKLKGALERVNVIAKLNEYQTVILNFAHSEDVFDGDGLFTVSAKSPDGKAEEKFVVKMTGKNLNIAFNVNYLLDALKTFETVDCTMNLTEPLAPIDLREVENGKTIHVITPVRTQN